MFLKDGTSARDARAKTFPAGSVAFDLTFDRNHFASNVTLIETVWVYLRSLTPSSRGKKVVI